MKGKIGRKLFVDVRWTSRGQVFDLYVEARPEELLPKDKGLTRITVDTGMTCTKLGVALASFAPEDNPVVIEMRKFMDPENNGPRSYRL